MPYPGCFSFKRDKCPQKSHRLRSKHSRICFLTHPTTQSWPTRENPPRHLYGIIQRGGGVSGTLKKLFRGPAKITQDNFGGLARTPLLPSMLATIQSRLLTSIAFFLNNSHGHLIYTSVLCFCSFYCFHFASSCIHFIISHLIFIRRRL